MVQVVIAAPLFAAPVFAAPVLAAPVLAAIGVQEWLIIAFVVVLLFGARKLPELARSMGSSVNEFKKGMAEGAKPEGEKPRSETRSSSPVNGSTKEP